MPAAAALSSPPYEWKPPMMGPSMSHHHHHVDTIHKTQSEPDIIDIRQAAVEINLKEEIDQLLHPKEGLRKLPTLLLYDERGLQLFEEITYLDEYYLTNHEIEVLQNSARNIAEALPSGSMFVELGSGNLRKVALLLQALEDAGKDVDYYALDLSREELFRTLAQLPSYRHVRCHGLLGTYDDGREWLKQPSVSHKQKCIATLGSSIGNFDRQGAADFLKGFADALQPSDMILAGLDSCTNPSKVYHAYNDREGVTHRFVLNGLVHANSILDQKIFDLRDWQVIGEYVYDKHGGRHQAFYSPKRDVVILGETIKAQERIQIEQSLKYSKEGCDKLWASAGLVETARWMTDNQDYGLHLLERAPETLSRSPSIYAQSATPTLDDWASLWEHWDLVTRRMLPNEELLDKPIKLRNACIFYLGHIPTFLDVQLTKTTKTPPTEPAFFYSIFERGVDPDVDNPELCHSHSEIPDEWPSLEEILAYQERVRVRLTNLYTHGGAAAIPRNVARAAWIGFEHEIMHMETLLYMMLQSDKTLPPPIAPMPDFAAMAVEARAARAENKWFDIPAQQVTLGMEDPEKDLNFQGHFGWDNEKPQRSVQVNKFQAKGRPITNGEYAKYLYHTNSTQFPTSWDTQPTHSNGVSRVNGVSSRKGMAGEAPPSFLENKSVRTVYGPVPLKLALDWPLFASYDELAGCAAWMGGRIPTLEEARSIYAHVDRLKKADAERKLGRTVPAVNGHLINDGVQDSPPPSNTPYSPEVGKGSDDLFVDLNNANVGFQHWHPVAVTGPRQLPAGQAELGGVWEWTSSALERHEGFEPMELYPLYTADFFDGKHNVVLGGSWATHPRIAGRKSFVNWYQRNYPYAWCGARLVRDI